MLYVEADNAPALAVYQRLGFTRWDVDVMFRKAPQTGWPAGLPAAAPHRARSSGATQHRAHNESAVAPIGWRPPPAGSIPPTGSAASLPCCRWRSG